MNRALAFAGLLPFLLGADLLQSPNRAVEEGNARLKEGKAEEALREYEKAAAKLPGDPGVHFNRAAALFALSRFEEAVPGFLRATEARAAPLKAAAFYNLGNSFFKLEKYGDAIAAYKRALVIDPGDMRAKWNLELALKKKREQDEKKQDQGQDDQDQKRDQQQDGKQDQDRPQSQQQKPEPEPRQDQKQAGDQKQPPDQKQAQDQPPGQEQERPTADKEQDLKQIEAILDGLERSPKDLEKERAQLRAVRRAPPAKDW